MRHLPNILCIMRMFLVLPLLMLLFNGEYVWAFFVFGFAGFTDLLDGFLARRFQWHSQLGSILDPVADKLLMLCVIVVLAQTQMVPALLALLVIGRDLIIVTGVVIYHTLIGPVTAQASLVSKFNTAVQLLFVLIVISNAAFGFPHQLLVLWLGALVIVTTLVSGLDYVREGVLRALALKKQVV